MMEEQNGLPELPANWTWGTLSELCIKIQDGTHFSPKDQFASGQYKYITAKNVRPSGLDLSDIAYLSEFDHRAIYERCDPKRDDVLVVKDGVNTGDTALNTLDEEFSLLSSVCLLRPEQSLLSSPFLRYYLLSPVGYRLLTGQMTGTAIKRIILRRIKELPSPVAPLPEQHRIVAKIEELFTKLDAGVESLKAAKKQIKRYRQSVLKAAVEGELTKQWREQHKDELEPASVLLERILRERRAKWEVDQLAKMQAQGKPPKDDKWKAKYQEPVKLEATDLLAIPEKWTQTTIDQISVCLDSMRVPINKKERAKRIGEIPYFGANGQVGWIDDYLFDEPLVLVVEDETFTGREKPFSYKIAGKSWVNNHAHILKATGAIVIDFLNYSLAHYPFIPLTTGTTGRRKLTQAALMSAPYALPPLAEQVQIVAEIERRLSITDEIEASLDAELKRAERLRQSILKRAFEGKLVPQDPNDEPASVLLERIKAERALKESQSANGNRAARRTKSSDGKDEPTLPLE